MPSYRLQSRRSIFDFGMSLTNQLIILNVFFFIVALFLLSSLGEGFLDKIALKPSLIFSGKSLWTFITSMFMHGSFFHLFANMFSLFFIGNFLEKIVGKKRFFWLYLFSGIIGGLFFVVFANFFGVGEVGARVFGGPDILAVGASGAIFGLLGLLAILVPYSKIYLIAGPLILLIVEVILENFLPKTFSSPLSLIVNVLFFIMIFAMFSPNPSTRKIAFPIELPMWALPFIAIIPLVIISFFISLPIGNSAHLGGLVVGLAYGFYLKKKFPRKTQRIRNYFA